MGWLDKVSKSVSKSVSKAAHFAANPMELTQLDEIVNHLVMLYGNDVNFGEVTGGPPTEEQCAAKELEWEAKYNEQYNIDSAKKTGRKERDEKDNIAVRRRIMNRQFRAMRGKLYARFSDQVDSLKSQASTAITLASETLDDTISDLQECFPCQESVVIDHFDDLRKQITEQINASFPGGENALDVYDDDLADGVPSLAELRAAIDAKQAEQVEANRQACAAAVLEVKRAIRAQTVEQLTAAVEDIRSQLNVTDALPFLSEEDSSMVLQEAGAELDEFMSTAVTDLMENWTSDVTDGDGDAPAEAAEAEA